MEFFLLKTLKEIRHIFFGGVWFVLFSSEGLVRFKTGNRKLGEIWKEQLVRGDKFLADAY